MSDLPPSTIPPEDEQPLSHRSDEGEADREIHDGDATKSEDREQGKDDADKDDVDDEDETRRKSRVGHEKVSDNEDEARVRTHSGHLSEEDNDKQLNLPDENTDQQHLPTGGLTTMLVRREDEEKKRPKQNNKTKKQMMKKLAKRKSKRLDGKENKDKSKLESDDEFLRISDADVRRRGLREAPFLKQYEDKKHIEHILEEQHYWSDPEADTHTFETPDNLSRILNSEYSINVESGEDTGPDGIEMHSKTSKHDKRKKHGDGDDMSSSDSANLRQKIFKRAGSMDSMISVEDPENIDHTKSKRRLNEHVIKTDTDDDTNGHDNGRTRGKTDVDEHSKAAGRSEKTRTIFVKEHSDMMEGSIKDDVRRTRKKKKGVHEKENDIVSDNCDTDIDKLSDKDSGVDDEDGDVDVVLTQDQQQMIVNMLFDDDMNLRSHFYRSENGLIVRRLDNTAIYDPHTGRFTFRKRLGQIFKVRRLKRNDKGRPLGGYVDDDFGPKADGTPTPMKTSSAPGSQREKSAQFSTSNTRSSSADMKRMRAEGRYVGFSVPDDDIESIADDQLEYNKRGRRDIGSAIRRKLNRRLFKKKKKHNGRGYHGMLPELTTTKAWLDGEQYGSPSMTGQDGVSPIKSRNGRYSQHGSPWAKRRTPGTWEAGQWQLYREGLQGDRRILENLQDRLNSRDRSERDGSVVEFGEEEDDDMFDSRPCFDRGYSYVTDDGRLVVHERGCPELKQPPFTVVRQPGEQDSHESLHNPSSEDKDTQSATLQVQDYNEEHTDNEQNDTCRHTPERSLVTRSNDGRSSQMTSIDDSRLRRLLEELYKDKKYFDQYAESKDPQSEEFMLCKGLAEHGKGFLLERAEFWEKRGPIPPRPPMTAAGWRMQREHTLLASRQASERCNSGCSSRPGSPDPATATIPGVVESPRQNDISMEEINSRNTPNETFV